jgi:hypothetical protein
LGCYTLEIFEGETHDQAFAAAGIAPTARDTVVLLTRFSPRSKPGGRFVQGNGVNTGEATR